MTVLDNIQLSAFYTLLTLWMLGALVTAQSPPHLCDECQCEPNREAPVTVNCMCDQKNLLIFQDHYTDAMVNATHLNISSCTFLSLPVAGFGRAPRLHYVEIKNLKLFHLVPNVFPNLKRLYIDNVKELILNSFTGLPGFESLIILRSKMNELSTDSFHSISTLKEIILNQVYIGKILSHGVDADFGDEDLTGEDEGRGTSFSIQSSKISEIDSNALNIVNLRLFQMINSTVETIKENGLNISSNTVNIISNRFGTLLSNQSFIFSANYIQINFNEFHYLPNNILNSIYTPNKVNFLHNIIFDLDLGGFLLNLDFYFVNFKYNKILCNCAPNKVSYLKLNHNFPGIQINNETELIVDNFCLSHDQISLYLFKQYLINGTMCSGDVVLNDNLSDGTTETDNLIEDSSPQMGHNPSQSVISGGSAALERRGALEVMVALIVLCLSVRCLRY
uniref:Uncharacterized protein n=1 Tax=Cacopsylla melanoneura TaxID=428564 RepID=A0A8D8YII4_9HEMI